MRPLVKVSVRVIITWKDITDDLYIHVEGNQGFSVMDRQMQSSKKIAIPLRQAL